MGVLQALENGVKLHSPLLGVALLSTHILPLLEAGVVGEGVCLGTPEALGTEQPFLYIPHVIIKYILSSLGVFITGVLSVCAMPPQKVNDMDYAEPMWDARVFLEVL